MTLATTRSSWRPWNGQHLSTGGLCSTIAAVTRRSSVEAVSLFAPARRRGHEILDDAGVDARTRIRSIGDVTRSNVLFGGLRAAVSAIEDLLTPGASLTV